MRVLFSLLLFSCILMAVVNAGSVGLYSDAACSIYATGPPITLYTHQPTDGSCYNNATMLCSGGQVTLKGYTSSSCVTNMSYLVLPDTLCTFESSLGFYVKPNCNSAIGSSSVSQMMLIALVSMVLLAIHLNIAA